MEFTFTVVNVDSINHTVSHIVEKVSSNLWREYGIEDERFDIEVIQTEMLNAAKKHIGQLPQDFRVDFTTLRNVSGADTEETIDFEILTEIQHYEGKTNLIDFTKVWTIS